MVSGMHGFPIISSVTLVVYSDLTQILGCLSDHRSNPQLKRRRETEVLDSPDPESQSNYHGSLWEQTSFAGGSLQRQIAATKLDRPPLMQTPPYAPTTNTWGVNDSFAPQTDQTQQPLHSQPSFNMTDPVYNNFSHPIAQNADPTSFVADTNFQLPSPIQAAQLPLEVDFSNDLMELWANLPLSFGCVLFSSYFRPVQN